MWGKNKSADLRQKEKWQGRRASERKKKSTKLSKNNEA